MKVRAYPARRAGILLMAAVLSVASARAASAQNTPTADEKGSLEIYGFAMLDMGFQAKQNDSNWFDVLRPTKLPAFQDEFGQDGRWFSSVRQSRLGVRSSLPTELGDLKTIFEFELFGTGVDAGQTTFRLRHAWGEVGHFGAGQTWSPFMDPDVFPNSLEYWGPNGMVFFRNVQVRWMPMKGDSSAMLAIERPGASADQGVVADRIALQNVTARFPLPDFSGAYKLSRPWGYVRGAFLLGEMKWDDNVPDAINLSGSATRWGLNFSSNLKVPTGVIRLQYAFGDGIENYMNDAPVDVGVQLNPGNVVTPLLGKALPVKGTVVFYDHTWSKTLTTAVGYSRLDMDNTDGQPANAFKNGQYALVNLLATPAKNVMVGGEFQWGRRENFSDGFSSNDYRFQFSFKYNFSYKVGG
jgi:hypothetical protein